ncbi:MAG: glycosyltransferase [Bacteroidales bacterium]|nr:glycosyltransferase [Bacteroidales bacterium]
MINNPLVSVIIPIYKVEPYLRECVESVINQTYKNLEIILVDDGSPDNCPKICEEYALQDSRIKVIHKENGGLSDARNAGMKIATADYWSFVDSDDVCHPQMIEVLMEPLIEDKGLKMSACTYTKNSDKWNENFNNSAQKISALDYMSIDFWTVAWGKIYHKSLFYDIEYPKGRLHEDEFTTYKLAYNSGKVGYVDSPYYYYRQREDSITGTPSIKGIADEFIAHWERLDFFEEENATDFLGKSINMFSHNIISNKKIIKNRIKESIKKCSYQDLSLYSRIKINLKMIFPFIDGIKKRLFS